MRFHLQIMQDEKCTLRTSGRGGVLLRKWVLRYSLAMRCTCMKLYMLNFSAIVHSAS